MKSKLIDKRDALADCDGCVGCVSILWTTSDVNQLFVFDSAFERLIIKDCCLSFFVCVFTVVKMWFDPNCLRIESR